MSPIVPRLLGVRWLDTALDSASAPFSAPAFPSKHGARKYLIFSEANALTAASIPISALPPIQTSVKPEHSKTPSVFGGQRLDSGFDSHQRVPSTQSSVKPEHSKTPSVSEGHRGDSALGLNRSAPSASKAPSSKIRKKSP
jgi:hypothetical protein